jgi:hypothetical protein
MSPQNVAHSKSWTAHWMEVLEAIPSQLIEDEGRSSRSEAFLDQKGADLEAMIATEPNS